MWYIIYKNSKEVTTMRKELLKGLSEEQIKKVEACKNSEELLNLAKAGEVNYRVVYNYVKCRNCGKEFYV